MSGFECIKSDLSENQGIYDIPTKAKDMHSICTCFYHKNLNSKWLKNAGTS